MPVSTHSTPETREGPEARIEHCRQINADLARKGMNSGKPTGLDYLFSRQPQEVSIPPFGPPQTKPEGEDGSK